MNVVAGYGGVRLSDDELVLKAPRPPPNCTKLNMRRVSFRGAWLNFQVSATGWSAVLDEAPPTGVVLQLVLDTGATHTLNETTPSSWYNGSAKVVQL